MIGIVLGFLVGVFVSWTSFTIGMERQAHIETRKEELYEEILNERNYYKKHYDREFDRANSGY